MQQAVSALADELLCESLRKIQEECKEKLAKMITEGKAQIMT